MKYAGGHVEVFGTGGEFLFSADTELEARRELAFCGQAEAGRKDARV